MQIIPRSQKAGDIARFISPEFSFDNDEFCLSWFYHMFGKDFIYLLNMNHCYK